ncbi:MAG: hypothetical protein V4608_02755 [Bacteroidota bacterium]
MKNILLENEEVTIELENGIVIAKWKSTSVDLDIAQQAVKYRLEATNYKSYPILSNIRAIKNISKPARDFLATEKGCEGITAAAVLIDSPLGSMIGNFFISISRPLRPTKIFTDEADAKKWLTQYVEKNSI